MDQNKEKSGTGEKKRDTYRTRFAALAKSFLKIGAFTFGGGYAMIPLISREMVEKHGWLTDKEMLDIFAVAECTPGVIAVNCATFVGYKVAGYAGATLATICVVFPAFVIISIISLFVHAFKNLEWVAYAFSGIRVGIIILLFMALLKFVKHIDKNIFSILLIAAAFLLSAFTTINTIWLLMGAIVLGIFINLYKVCRCKRGGK